MRRCGNLHFGLLLVRRFGTHTYSIDARAEPIPVFGWSSVFGGDPRKVRPSAVGRWVGGWCVFLGRGRNRMDGGRQRKAEEGLLRPLVRSGRLLTRTNDPHRHTEKGSEERKQEKPLFCLCLIFLRSFSPILHLQCLRRIHVIVWVRVVNNTRNDEGETERQTDGDERWGRKELFSARLYFQLKMNLFYFLLRSFLSFMSVFTMLLHSLVGVCSRYIALSTRRSGRQRA